jgi:BRCT domain type II-containing protein
MYQWPGKPQEPPPLAGQRPPPPEGQDGCFDGISIVVTGTLDSLSRDEAQELIQRYGVYNTAIWHDQIS